MVTDEDDLQSLSRVLDTGLSILFARAAVISLLMHITAGARTSVPRCHPYAMAARHPSPSLWSLTTNGPGVSIHAGKGMLSPSFCRDPWGDDWGRGEGGMKVADGILEMLAVTENQRRIVDLTKVIATWQISSRSKRARKLLSVEDSEAAGARNTALVGRNEFVDGSRFFVCFDSPNVAIDPNGLFPGLCLVAMRSLLDLVVSSIKPRDEWKAWVSATLLSEQRKKNDPSPSASSQQSGDVARAARIPSLTRLLKLFVREAISTFETGPSLKKIGLTGSDTLPLDGQNAERGSSTSASEPFAPRSKFSWALWVLETLMALEIDGRNSSLEPVLIENGEENDAEDVTSDLPEEASGQSPQAFAAVLGSAIGDDLDEAQQTLAYSLCSYMLHLSRPATTMCSNSLDSSKGCPKSRWRSPDEDRYARPSQERVLARAFSVRFRSQTSTPNSPSHLLQSQLELLAQWELRRSVVNGTHRSRGQNEQKVGVAQLSSPEAWNHTGRMDADGWDVATAMFAGVGGGGDGFEMVHEGNSRAAGRGKRVGTAESEASVPSSLPTPPYSGKLTPIHRNALLVEAVSATSVTVSWGGWFETGDEPELQVGVDGDGLAYPVAFGKVAGASGLAQALRSKLKLAASQRRGEGPSMVLKVSAGGLWGSEPYHVAALDLHCRGCLKVHGLAADTRYSFRLERRTTSPSIASPPAAADLSDDERSCFPSAATVGANSTEGSSADQLGADVADGASALTGVDGSHGRGGGGASTSSEGCTTVFTDESLYCTSSTRAVAGRNRSPSSWGRCTNKRAVDGDEFKWPSTCGRDRFCGSSEDFVLGRANGAIVATVSVATPPEIPFMLDAEGCGPNLRLTNSNLTVINTGRKKWSAVRATRGFACGLHCWKVRIDRCVSKNVFVGVVSSESALDNYIGSDRSGWGYLANKAIWHNKGKVRSYGDLFREGDTIETLLNMDLGTLRFARNGRDLGMAVKGLEGTLFPAFSLYNRNDQLTFMPPEDHVPPSPSRGDSVDEKNGARPTRVGGGVDVHRTYSDVLYGTFTAECVVRRAAKALEVLGALNDTSRLATNPASCDLVDNIRSGLLGWSRGEHGRSVASVRPCAPVRIDTSEQGRRDMFDLGVGDRVLSAEGEATVLGATRHSLWVAVEPTSSSSVCTPGLRAGSRTRGSEVLHNRREDAPRDFRGSITRAAANTATRSPSRRRLVGANGTKITPWSRCTVRQIIGHPDDYVVSRHTTPADLSEGLAPATNVDDNHDGTGPHETDGVVDVIDGILRTDEVQSMLSRWTPTMDEELGRHLAKLADAMEVATPLDLPFDALKQLPSSTEMFSGATPVTLAEVWARAALLLYVNDLILPLIPLIDASSDGRGPLSTLLHKCKYLIFKAAKLSLLESAIRPTTAVAPSEPGMERAPSFTIPLIGFKSLPRFPTDRLSAAKLRPISWATTTKEVDKSVFGQVARHLSNRVKHGLSEGTLAFSAELVDASTSEDGEGTTHDCLQMSDAPAQSRGVFWQVCEEVCSPPISMFVRPLSSAVDEASSAAPDSTTTSANNDIDGGADVVAKTPPEDHIRDAAPNPFFTSKGLPPACMDPERVSLYQSFGFIVGLAIRTGVRLPLSRLSPTWWKLVSDDEERSSSVISDKSSEITRSRAPCPGVAVSSSYATKKETSRPQSADGVVMALGCLEESGFKQEQIDEILTDARFVAPLSNGLVTELLHGGLNRPVTSESLGEYRARLARLRTSEYAPQASAFRAGLEAALPNYVLSLLTWTEMEELVCG